MKTKKVLHLFTAEFPFGISEGFLENKIFVLAKKFELIIVHPLWSDKNGTKRKVPENVIIKESVNKRDNLNSRNIFFKNIFFILKVLFLEFLHCSNKLFFISKIRLFNALLIRAIYDSSNILISFAGNMTESVFYSCWMNDWALSLAVLKAKKVIPAFVFGCGGFDIYDDRHEGNYLPFRYFIYKQASVILPNSKSATDYVIRKNIFPEKIKTQYLGTKDNGINKFNEYSKFTLVSCSNLIPLKRVHLIIEILNHINFDLNWIHFGNGKCFEELRLLASKLPSNINVEFKGNVSNKDIMEFYKINSVNLFITTSETESLPVSIQEAISFGIPIIATNVGGVSEIVNEKTGYLIDKKFDVKEVASLIGEFKNSSENSASFRNGVRNFWLNNFEANAVYEDFYQELIKY